MFCQQCGNSLDEKAIFCNRCGARVSNNAPVAPEAPDGAPVKVNGSMPNAASIGSYGEPTYGGAPTNPGVPYGSAPVNPGTPYGSAPVNPGTPYGSAPVNPGVPYGSAPVNPGTPYGSVPVNPNAPYGVAPTQEVADEAAEKKGKIFDKINAACLIAGTVGFGIFALVVIIGLIGWGRIYLFQSNAYGVTKFFAVVGMILMAVGFVSVILRVIMNLGAKIGKFPASTAKRVLIILLAVACLGGSILGWTNYASAKRASRNYGGAYSGDSTYVSLAGVYTSCGCTSPWATLGTDYLKIDTNPYDYDSDSSSSTTYMLVATSAIKSVNSKLGFPAWVYDDMLETRALDGKQTYTGTKASVSWTYHPDSGLEVRYVMN